MKPIIVEWMTPNPIIITSETTIDTAYRLMLANDIRHLPVVDSDTFLGIVTKSDIRLAKLTAAHVGTSATMTVAEIVQKSPTLTAEDTMIDATVLLLREKLSALPILNKNKRLIGLLTESDLLYYSVQQAKPLPDSQMVVLKDGREVVIRPISPHDAPQLRQLYANLSKRSLYYRFLEPYNPLKAKHIRRFAITDYNRQMAFVAIDPQTDKLIGMAQYLPLYPDEPGHAEFSIAIADDWQRNSLGKTMLTKLFDYARVNGIEVILGIIHNENRGMLRLMRDLGYKTERTIEQGIYEISIYVQQAIVQPDLVDKIQPA